MGSGSVEAGFSKDLVGSFGAWGQALWIALKPCNHPWGWTVQ